MEKEVRISREFSFLLDDSGRCEEIRHYRDEKLVARYVGVYDENDNMIGVRELAPESVAPESLLEKVKKRFLPRRVERPDYLNWIGVLNFIGTINYINFVGGIGYIGEIGNLRDLIWTPKTLITNYGFEQDFLGWFSEFGNAVIDEDGEDSLKCLKFPASKKCYVYQIFPIPIGVDWFTSLNFSLKANVIATDCLRIQYIYTEGTSSENFQVANADLWTPKICSPTAGKKIRWLILIHLDSWSVESKVDNFYMVF